ncbi:HD domain-containing protein [Georgenia satyanarayanai]|uniref:HD domain-containing protein n=1 Tax=Georgenia satyanarayanai TaxID=860221 RepID=UPI00186B09ED|nr:hypothetical protein [Georgenia satyanarayanai]
MSLADAPQWLVSAFVRSAVAVGATAPREQIQRTARELVERWQEPERRFHNLRHLIDVLARVDELAEETHVPDVVRLAAWYHGAVFNSSAQVAYARRGGEDEVASAALAREQLAELGVPDAVTERVQELISTLARHDADEHDVDALALCDADLATLAVEPQRYYAYKRAIREEYAHIPEPDYVASRLAILTKLLQRRRLFVSPFSLSWEEPARENLTAELSHLRARLVELGGTEHPAEECTARPGAATVWPSRGPAAPVPPAAATRPAEPSPPAPPPAGPPAPAQPSASAPATAPTPEAASRTAVTPDEPEDEDRALSGIEREPDFELRRRRRKRRERAAAQRRDEEAPSPSALFRPPPKLPRS